MKKRILAMMLLVVVMLGSLAGCGKSGQTTDPSSDGKATTESPTPAGKTKVTFWAPFSGGDGDIMKQMVADFNAQSETTEVEFLIFKSEEYYTKLLAAMTTDSAPTVAINHITRIKEYVEDGLLLPLDDFATDANVDFSEFTERLQNAAQVDGSYYAMPMDTHLLLMHFNKQLLSDMGMLEADGSVKIERGEEGFFKFFKEVQEKAPNGVMPISGTSMNGLPMYLWYTLLTQYGGDILDETGENATLDTEENKKALSVMMEMVDSGIWPKNQKNGAEIFTAKKAVATINGVWAVPTFESVEGLDFISVPFPQLTDTDSVYADSHSLVMPKNDNITDAERAAGMEFMKWITDNTVAWANAGHIPSKPAVVESEEFQSLPYRKDYAQSAEYAKFYPQSTSIAGFTELIYRELASMIAGEQDVDKTASDLQTEFQKLLDSKK